MGSTTEGLFCLIFAAFGFYICQWEEHHTGKLRTNIGHFGVTEGIVMMIIAVLCGAYTKGACFHTVLNPYLPFEIPFNLTMLLVVTVYLAMQAVICMSYGVVLSLKETKRSKVEMVTSFLPICYFLIAVYLLGQTKFFVAHPGIALYMLIPLYSLINSKLVICNVADMYFNPIQPIFLPWLLLLVDVGISEQNVLLLIFASNALIYVYFALTTIN